MPLASACRLPPRVVARRAFSPLRRLGDASSFGVSAQATATAQAQDLLAQLPPDIQTAVQAGNTYVAQGQPAFDLAKALASGQSVSSLQVVGAIGAVAGFINPIAGAAIVAMGTIAVEFQNLLQGVFQVLGLYEPPLPTYVFNGLLRQGDTVPYTPIANANGTQSFDPIWVHIDHWVDLQKFYWYGDANHPPLYKGGFPGPGGSGGASDIHTLKESYLFDFLDMALFMEMTPLEQWGWANATGSWPDGTVQPLDPKKVDPNSEDLSPSVMRASVQRFLQVNPQNFDGYFNKLLLLNLQYWANGQPFLPVRSLLYGAATAWNKSHAGPYALAGQCAPNQPIASTFCYAPVDPNNLNDPRVQAAVAGKAPRGGGLEIASGHSVASPIEMILGPTGAFADPQTTTTNSPPLGINTGAYNGPPSTSTKIAVAVAAGVPATAVVGSIVYSLAAGKTWDYALSAAWKGVLEFFE